MIFGRYIQYAKYIFRHKWFVMLACFARGLFWQGVFHDMSKLRPSEWFPYARFFYEPNGKKKIVREKSGYYKPTDTGDTKFDFAWLLHQKRNRHHWQWWVLPEDSGGVKILPMPDKYISEMIADWIGTGRAQGVEYWWNPSPWYEINKSKMRLHPETRLKVESELIAIDAGEAPQCHYREVEGGVMNKELLKVIKGERDDTLDWLVFWSFRYFLGRMTISTCDFAARLARLYPALSEEVQVLIRSELDREFERDDNARLGETCASGYLPLGHDCDRAAWETVRKLWRDE